MTIMFEDGGSKCPRNFGNQYKTNCLHREHFYREDEEETSGNLRERLHDVICDTIILKVNSVSASLTLVIDYQSARCHNPDDTL